MAKNNGIERLRAVADEFRRVLAWMQTDGASFAGMCGVEYDMIAWLDANGDPLTSPAWLFRWDAADTGAVLAAVRGLPTHTNVSDVVRAIAAEGVAIKQTTLF